MELVPAILGIITVLAGILVTVCSLMLPVIILGGIGYFIYQRSQQGKALREAAQAWRATTGTVMMSSVQSGHKGSRYPVVVYQYEVNGQRYQSQIIKAGEQYLNIRITGQAQETVNRYPIGATVTVYYNPDNPAEAALER